MLSFAVLGFILWILVLLWRINTKTVVMPVKEDETSSCCGLPAAEEATHIAHPGKHSLSTVPTTSTHNVANCPLAECTSAGPKVKTVHPEPPESFGVYSEPQPLPSTTQKPNKTNVPMLSSGPEARERLKFILGASEDNSSDEEPLVTKPPSGASQPPTAIPRCSPEQLSSAEPQNSSSSIKYVCFYLIKFKVFRIRYICM